jgi:DNA-binding MarR family transcriptional regulator
MKNHDKIELYNQFIRVHNKFALIKRKQVGASKTEDLYPAEMQVLCLINSSESTVTDIASDLSITKSAASQLVKKLCNKNMIQKYRCAENERVVVLKVTDKGKLAVDDFFNNESHVFGEMVKELSSISDQELKIIGLFFTKLEKMFDKKLQ